MSLYSFFCLSPTLSRALVMYHLGQVSHQSAFLSFSILGVPSSTENTGFASSRSSAPHQHSKYTMRAPLCTSRASIPISVLPPRRTHTSRRGSTLGRDGSSNSTTAGDRPTAGGAMYTWLFFIGFMLLSCEGSVPMVCVSVSEMVSKTLTYWLHTCPSSFYSK
jgi:hypothetical protein